MSVNEPEKWDEQSWVLGTIERVELVRKKDQWFLKLYPWFVFIPIPTDIGEAFYKVWIEDYKERERIRRIERGYIDG